MTVHETPQMEIVAYRPDMLDALGGIWHRAWTRAVPDIAAGVSEAELRGRVEAETAGRWECLVALVDGRPAGFAGLVPEKSQLDQLMVDVPWQGHGVGSVLLDAAKRRFPEGMWLRSAMVNLPAHRFYEARGFRRSETIRHETRGFEIGIFRWAP